MIINRSSVSIFLPFCSNLTNMKSQLVDRYTSSGLMYKCEHEMDDFYKCDAKENIIIIIIINFFFYKMARFPELKISLLDDCDAGWLPIHNQMTLGHI